MCCSAGVALIERDLADFLYLSTTDYMQHKHAPEEPEALDFYAAIDVRNRPACSRWARSSALTADHGMNAKQKRRRLAQCHLSGERA